MLYPSPPWTLKGLALITTQLIGVDAVRPWVPAEAAIVQVLPGQTLGALYFRSMGRALALSTAS